jgi:GGDEF domain-containing protein
MSLLNSMGSHSSPVIRLLLLESLPTTEDLKYMIATSQKSQKPIQLPFKRERDAPTFVVTYKYPNRWTFERGDGIAATTLWTKESSDVMVVQNKIKGDSAIYSNSGEGRAEQSTSHNSIPNFATANAQDTLQRIFPDRQTQSGRFPATQPPESMPFGDWGGGTTTGDHAPQNGETGAGNAPTTSTGEFAPTNLFESWMPESKGAQLPPPIELDPDAIDFVADLLRDPLTGLTSFQAFIYFLIRELIRHEVSGATLAVICFDFFDTATEQPIDLSDEERNGIVTHLHSLCSTLHFASRMDSGEFVILLCDAKPEDGTAFAEMLRQNFEADEALVYLCAGRALTFGIATAPHTCTDPGTLIAAALQMKDTARSTSNRSMVF